MLNVQLHSSSFLNWDSTIHRISRQAPFPAMFYINKYNQTTYTFQLININQSQL